MELIDLQAVRRVVDRLNAGRTDVEKIGSWWITRFHAILPEASGAWRRPGSAQLDQGHRRVWHGNGRAVIGANEYFNLLMLYRKDFGGVLSPKNAWPILVYGLRRWRPRMVNQQKSAMQVAEFLQRQAKVARVLYPGLPNFPQRELARRQMTTPDGAFAPGCMLYFELKGRDGTGNSAAEAAERFVDYVAEKSYTVTLAVSLGQIKTLIENPFSMTHAAIPDEEKIRCGLQPEASAFLWGWRTGTTSSPTWKTPWKWSDRKDR